MLTQSKETQQINVTDGEVEYTWNTVVTESTGKDISVSPLYISLGTRTDPGEWKTPDKDLNPSPNIRKVQLLVGAETAPGSYFVWIKLVDSPETVILRGQQVIVV